MREKKIQTNFILWSEGSPYLQPLVDFWTAAGRKQSAQEQMRRILCGETADAMVLKRHDIALVHHIVFIVTNLCPEAIPLLRLWPVQLVLGGRLSAKKI